MRILFASTQGAGHYQPQNAARAAGAGAGVVAPIDGIRAGIERVLENDSYGAAGRRPPNRS